MWSGDRDGNVELWNAETRKKLPKEGSASRDEGGGGKGKEEGEEEGKRKEEEEEEELPLKHQDKVSCFVLTHGRVMWSIAWDIDLGSQFLLWE